MQTARLLSVMAGVVLASASFSQGNAVEELNYPPDIVGAANMAQFSGNGGSCPLKVEFSASVTNSNNCTLTIAQFQTYSPSAQFFSDVNNIINQMSWQSTSGMVRRFFPFDEFWNWRNTNSSNPTRQWGKYYAELKVGTSVKKRWEWTVTPNTINSIGGFASGGSGGVGNPGGTGTSTNPSDTQGFWERLFVPSEESVDDLMDSLDRFKNWGPYGVYNALGSSNFDMTGYGGPQVGPVITFTIPMVGTQHIDCTPYEGWIKMWRALCSGALWLTIIINVYRRLYGGGDSSDN